MRELRFLNKDYNNSPVTIPVIYINLFCGVEDVNQFTLIFVSNTNFISIVLLIPYTCAIINLTDVLLQQTVDNLIT